MVLHWYAFFCVGVVYDMAHTREIGVFGGIAKRMPMLGTLFTFAAMASLGLPGLAGLWLNIWSLPGSFRIWTISDADSSLHYDFNGCLSVVDDQACLLWSI